MSICDPKLRSVPTTSLISVQIPREGQKGSDGVGRKCRCTLAAIRCYCKPSFFLNSEFSCRRLSANCLLSFSFSSTSASS